MRIKKIIKDGRMLKHFINKYGFIFDSDYKYCIDTKNKDFNILQYKNKLYSLRYFDGCFYPFLCEVAQNG